MKVKILLGSPFEGIHVLIRPSLIGAALVVGLMLARAATPAAAQGSGDPPPSTGAAPPGGSGGQDPQGKEGGEEAKPASEPTLTAHWRDGFVLESQNGDFRLQIGALLHADARFSSDDGGALSDTFLIRRVRPSLRGRFARRFEFFLNPDFAGGTVVVQDAYIDTVFAPAFRLRIGKGKAPFGLERLQPVSNLLFFERALPTLLVPNRDVGIQALGELAGGLVSYMGGVMNGVPDGASGDLDVNDSKDVLGRVVIRPFAGRVPAMQGLGFALAGSSGRQTGSAALPTFRTVSAQRPFLSYLGVTAEGTRTRYSPGVFYYRKAFAGFGEYVHSGMPMRRGDLRRDVAHEAWQIAASVVLTGETATDSGVGVRPRANFDPDDGHFGAVQIAARYHALEVDRERLFGIAAPESSFEVRSWTIGANWFLTPNFKYVFNYERTSFDRESDGRATENAFVFRTQVNF